MLLSLAEQLLTIFVSAAQMVIPALRIGTDPQQVAYLRLEGKNFPAGNTRMFTTFKELKEQRNKEFNVKGWKNLANSGIDWSAGQIALS